MLVMSYGDLPDKETFTAVFDGAVTDEEGYHIHLKGTDLGIYYLAVDDVVGYDLPLYGVGYLTPDEMYALLLVLVDLWGHGNEDAGSLASSILYTLGIEWV